MVTVFYKVLNLSAFEAAVKAYIASGNLDVLEQDFLNLYVVADAGPNAGIPVLLADLTLPVGATAVDFIISVLVDECSCEYRLFYAQLAAIRRAFNAAFDEIATGLAFPVALSFITPIVNTLIENLLQLTGLSAAGAEAASEAFATAYAAAIAAGATTDAALAAGIDALEAALADAGLDPTLLAAFITFLTSVLGGEDLVTAVATLTTALLPLVPAVFLLPANILIFTDALVAALTASLDIDLATVDGHFNLGIIPHGCACPARTC